MDKALRDLIDYIQFTENVAAQIHGILDEAEIFRIVTDEFVRSERSMAGIMMLAEGGRSLRVAQVSLSTDIIRTLEQMAASAIEEFRSELDESSILWRVIRDEMTVQTTRREISRALLPEPLATRVLEIIGFETEPSIATPLYRHGKATGILMMMAPQLAEYFIPSVRNLARHISAALDLAEEHAERKRAEELLRKHRDQLEDLVRERTSSLEEANTALRVMLKTADRVKGEMEEAVTFNVKRFVLPYIEDLKKTGLTEKQKTCVEMLERSLSEVTEPFLQGVPVQALTLTPTELTVANLIKQGKTTKEIADYLGMSIRTVETHRYNIRSKLGLKNRTVNLRTYLTSVREMPV